MILQSHSNPHQVEEFILEGMYNALSLYLFNCLCINVLFNRVPNPHRPICPVHVF